ncbi:ETX/MTX2 family pore-forming toxin [Bacillus cereus]|uniref:ETX/MTX2 family pore-forming toxin n=1 Tax=Bacillus cereus TaxID=1396 RepID=UPI0024059BAB|nr:ETX/MTX2 family pore-forming toxin [Bacillus cereus]MDF9507344.1 ETX/MTX2 family pore-forming toxin [Bacillus cereus]MDF9595199.1 ETX/MTX2 family pore-forming toxin [Bacillus cereus]MDF9608254.1 ETX/MTX2 family pore-forming toxin [Bacillus cereus]MDF9659821.1 ETX/MTX2 family pore-forming toxin [Bacillus cereus]
MKKIVVRSFLLIGIALGGISITKPIHAEGLPGSINQPAWSEMQIGMGKIAYCAGYGYTGPRESWNFPIPSENRGINLVQQFSQGYGPYGVLPTNQYVELAGEPVIQDSKSLSVGNSTLTNETNQEMNMNTPEFSYEKTYSTTTTTTKAFDLGIKQTETIKIPLVEHQTEISAGFSMSNTGSTEESTKSTYTVPSQSIPTLPGHSYKVEYMLAIGKASGKVNFYGDATGTLPILDAPEYHTLGFLGAGDALSIGEKNIYYGDQFKESWVRKDEKTISYKGGQATYEAEYGYDFFMKVTDTTTNNVRNYSIKDFRVRTNNL